MIYFRNIVVLFCVLCITSAANLKYNDRETRNDRSFPSDFIFGVATSSFQVEGAWNEGGRGWSWWDYIIKTNPGFIADGSTHEIASDSYHQYKRDIQLVKQLGVKVYRFSISWPRILPLGTTDYVNPEGIAYYNNLINELLANGITPIVTIYHWDLPLRFGEQGAWLNEDIADWAGDYARVVYQHFGDRVKTWLTINEPYILCSLGYGYGMHAPGIISPGEGFYECGRNVLLAHARMYHIYHDEFGSQGGQVALVFSCDMALPSTDSQDDAEAVEDYFAFQLGQYADPIYAPEGNYPKRLIDRVANVSAEQGLQESRLRPFTQDQIDYIKGTSDFFALNSYSSFYVYKNESLDGTFVVPSFEDDMHIGIYTDPSWTIETSPWMYAYAPGLHKLLVYIKDTYNNPTIYITENGFSDKLGLYDDTKVSHYRGYLNAVLDAIDDGVDVRAYCAWSLMDTFEWNNGYTMRMGLYELDTNDPQRAVYPRKSAFVYKEIVRSRYIDPNYNPDPLNQDISL